MKISIITPTYNQGKFIKDTINSIRESKLNLKNELEYIIIDSLSNDETEKVINENIDIIDLYIREKDEGQADAINKGLSLVKGTYFNWLNSDDYLFPKTLEVLDNLTDEFSDFDLIAFQNLNCYEEGGHFNGWGGNGRSNWEIEIYNIFKGTIVFSQESTFIRKQFLDDNKIILNINAKNTFDHLFYYEILMQKPKILLIDIIAGVMRVHGESITLNGKDFKDVYKYNSNKKKIIGKFRFFLIKVFHFKYTKWIFRIVLLFLKKGIRINFLSAIPIPDIFILENNSLSILGKSNRTLKKIL